MAEITNEYIVKKLQNEFTDKIFGAEEQYYTPVITADKDINTDILRYLYDDAELQMQFLTTLCGQHLPDNELQLGVIYHLHSLQNNKRLRLKFYLPLENPVINSATKIFAAANWMERETYDFFGVIFEGHPDLRRILNVEEMEAYPMRKEYPLEDPNRIDKKDKYFGR